MYQKMYAVLCAAVSEALDVLPFTANNVMGKNIRKTLNEISFKALTFLKFFV